MYLSIKIMNVKLDGFHGTDMNKVDSILKKGFKPSVGNKEWLGDGAYFFVKGLNEEPELQAEQWAIISAWNKAKKKNDYDEFAVLHGIIEVDENKYLDLTIPNGVKVLDYIQEKLTNKLATISKKLEQIDGYLINFARGEKLIDIEVVKGNVYIKLRKEDRIHRLSRRTANSTICSVFSPQNNITKISLINKGRINYEIG